MTDPLYAVDPPQALRRVALGELTAFYHRPSGQTHIVSEPVPEILDALQEKASSAPALLESLTGSDAKADAEALNARLKELEAIGLVFRA